MKGFTTLPSDFTVKETIDRLVALAESKGMTVFLRLDHADNAIRQGLQLQPTELVIFGNPKAGTVLMQDNIIAAIDLPVKALSWQDEAGNVWLGYNEISWIAERHQLTEKSSTMVKAIEEGMASLCKLAATR